MSVAQYGGVDPAAKVWKGQGPGVLEIVEDFDRATYRAVYTVRFTSAIYVLHCFQKKSPSGVRTSWHDVELIETRLREAHRAGREREWPDDLTRPGVTPAPVPAWV